MVDGIEEGIDRLRRLSFRKIGLVRDFPDEILLAHARAPFVIEFPRRPSPFSCLALDQWGLGRLDIWSRQRSEGRFYHPFVRQVHENPRTYAVKLGGGTSR